MSHITGGGFIENIPRALPENLGVSLDVSNVKVPEILSWLLEQSGMTKKEAYNVFNMGIGFIIVIAENETESALNILKNLNTDAQIIGEVTANQGIEING